VGTTPLGFALLHLQLRDLYAYYVAGLSPADVGLAALGVPAGVGEQGVLESCAWALASLGFGGKEGSGVDLAREVSAEGKDAQEGAAGAGAGAAKDKEAASVAPWLKVSPELTAILSQRTKEREGAKGALDTGGSSAAGGGASAANAFASLAEAKA
jgi:hypothetical protein